MKEERAMQESIEEKIAASAFPGLAVLHTLPGIIEHVVDAFFFQSELRLVSKWIRVIGAWTDRNVHLGKLCTW